MMFGITLPHTVANLFGNWYKQCGKDSSLLLLAGRLPSVGPYGSLEMIVF